MSGFGTDSSFTVYIGGLSYSTEEEGLKTFLSDNGVNPVDVRIVSRDGQSKGFGYADFDSKEEFDKCIALNGMELDQRTLRCNEADKKPAAGGQRSGGGGASRSNFDNETPSKLLMVKNLSWSTDDDSLYSVFPDACVARVCRFSDTGKSRGFAFVEFNDVDAATKAREDRNGREIDGREVNIVFAEPRR